MQQQAGFPPWLTPSKALPGDRDGDINSSAVLYFNYCGDLHLPFLLSTGLVHFMVSVGLNSDAGVAFEPGCKVLWKRLESFLISLCFNSKESVLLPF